MCALLFWMEHCGIYNRCILGIVKLQWLHNEHDGVSDQQPHDCLRNRLFGRRSKKISKLRVTGLCVGNSPVTRNSPHKWPVTRKMFPFNDVIIVFTPKNTGNIDGYLTTTKHNKTCTVCLSLGIHDMPLLYTAWHPVKQYWVDALSRVSMFW